jgi:hypothetical protein
MPRQIISVEGTTGTGVAIPSHNAKQIAWYIIWAEDVTAGKVVIETAHHPDYVGVHSEITNSEIGVDALEGQCYHGTFPGPLPTVRARITTTVSGGATPKVTVIFVLFDEM